MYGCSSCKGNDHKIPVYFTRYFRKELPYTAQSLLKQYLPAGKGTPVLVPLSTGSTSMVGQRDMLELLLDLQKKDKFRFVFKLHPTCFNIDDYDMSDPIDRAERDNVEFLHKNFVVTSEEQPCLLPFYEAFEVILCDLHSSVGYGRVLWGVRV